MTNLEKKVRVSVCGCPCFDGAAHPRWEEAVTKAHERLRLRRKEYTSSPATEYSSPVMEYK